MKLKNYKLKGWDGLKIEMEINFHTLTIKLLAIDFIDDPPKEGRRNLLAVDSNNEIQWIADIPESYPMYGSYQDMRLSNELLEAWCGSIYCIIDPFNGKILSEKFVK